MRALSEQKGQGNDFDTLNRVFLERRSYRQRRIIDAARILPIVGLLLWFVPLVWPNADSAGTIKTSTATLYIFAIWIGLIVLGAFLAWRMGPAEDASNAPNETGHDVKFDDQRNRGPDR